MSNRDNPVTTESEPRTEGGRTLLEAIFSVEGGARLNDPGVAIAAIEAEAAQGALDGVRPVVGDVHRNLEIAFARWYEAHRVGETGEFRFGRVDGPFMEAVRSTIDRLAALQDRGADR